MSRSLSSLKKVKESVVWNTYNLHEFKFSASDSKICVRYDNLKFKQLLSLFWNHFGTIWPCFSYWFLVSFWGYFHIKGYYQLTNTSSDLTPFFLGFKLKELAEIRQFEPKNSHSSDTKVAWNPYEVMGKTTPTGKCTPRREDIFKYGNQLFDNPLLL